MRQVVRLQGKILQVRDVDAPQCVGYGATQRVSGPARLATVAAGYADGYLRALSNRGVGRIGGVQVPVVGRVSMDLITFDLSAVPAEVARPGATIDLLGPDPGVDELGRRGGTIGYEILTALGRRYHRAYLGG
jgi:alanine racemase